MLLLLDKVDLRGLHLHNFPDSAYDDLDSMLTMYVAFEEGLG